MERRTVMLGSLVGMGLATAARPFDGLEDPGRSSGEDAAYRLQRAGDFLPAHHFDRLGDFLYRVGIVAQLALTACLIDVGWSDENCRQRIGLNVAKALFFARAAGLRFQSDHFDQLVPLLSPYGGWRLAPNAEAVKVAVIDVDDTIGTMDVLLEAVRSFLAGVRGPRASL